MFLIKSKPTNKIPCRYGPKCTNKPNCIYSHAKIKLASNQCGEGYMCTNRGCQLNHPSGRMVDKSCMYGNECPNMNCYYVHEEYQETEEDSVS